MIRRAKGMLLVASIAVVIAFALPSIAHAATKATTRIYTSKSSFVVQNSDASATAAAPTAAGKLQKYTGGRWVNISGTVKIYRYDDYNETWDYYASRYAKGGLFNFTVSSRGKYKAFYAGNTYNKPTYRYYVRKDRIVSSLPEATVTITDEGNGTSSVKISQTVVWNEVAYPDLMGMIDTTFISFDPLSEDPNAGVMLMPFRTVNTSGTYDVTYIVDNDDLFPTQLVSGSVQFIDEYILSQAYGDAF